MLTDMELLGAIAVVSLAAGQLLTAILLVEQNWRIGTLKERIMTLVDDLKFLREQLDKARGEIVAKIASLEEAVNAAPQGPDPAVLEAVAALKVSAQSLDDVVPDSVVDAAGDAPDSPDVVAEEVPPAEEPAAVEEAAPEEVAAEEAIPPAE